MSVQAKANELGTKAFMAAPPKVQNGILVGIGKAQPVVNAAKPHAKQLVGGAVGLLALRRLRRR
ncbi:MAG: hypothetical protein JWO22_4149 [Frankiales bacterium]|nr:hypothetical protein [Frankiales bacterium]